MRGCCDNMRWVESAAIFNSRETITDILEKHHDNHSQRCPYCRSPCVMCVELGR